jgi:hypothetical protein
LATPRLAREGNLSDLIRIAGAKCFGELPFSACFASDAGGNVLSRTTAGSVVFVSYRPGQGKAKKQNCRPKKGAQRFLAHRPLRQRECRLPIH